MKRSFSAAAIGALLALPLCAHAEQSRQQPHPADPGAAVPPLVYEPAIGASVRPRDGAGTPDQVWRAANEAVADGHGSHGSHGIQARPEHSGAHDGHAASPAPSKPDSRPPVEHGKHH